MTLNYWYGDRGEVCCENKHGLMFTLPGPPPEWRPRVTATELLTPPARPQARPVGRP